MIIRRLTMISLLCGGLALAAAALSGEGQTYEFYDEGEYSPTPTPSATVSPTPTCTITMTPEINRSSLILASTAYTNKGLGRRGFKADAFFHVLIGQLFGRNPDSGRETEGLLKMMTFGIGGDAKYVCWPQRRYSPAAALGLAGAVFRAGAQDTSGGEIRLTEGSYYSTWDVFLVASRSLGPPAFHVGYKYGTFPRQVGFYSRFLGGIKTVGEEDEPDKNFKMGTLYGGLDLPLGRVRRFRLEGLYPLGMERHPLLINTCVDSLMNFNISYLRFAGGYSVLGYFNQGFTVYER